MADSPQNPPLHAGYVVRRVLHQIPPRQVQQLWLMAFRLPPPARLAGASEASRGR